MTNPQLAYKGRLRFKKKPKARAFAGAPHRKGIIYKITTMSPRKPNSAKRTFAKVRLIFSKKKVFAKIPGIGDHYLQAHSIVFLRVMALRIHQVLIIIWYVGYVILLDLKFLSSK
jgi:small subunit ribosomal protein S12